MDVLEFSAMQAVRKCLNLQANETVVIITDNDRLDLAQAIKKEVLKITSHLDLFVMESFGDRPEDGSTPLKFPNVIRDKLKQAQVSFYIADSKKGELFTFRMPMSNIINASPNLRHAHMVNITKEVMLEAMGVDYDAVKDMSDKVFSLVKNCKSITVTTPAGTHLTGYFSKDIRWVNSSGVIEPKHWQNLPSGEVFTCVDRIDEATIVVDGVLGDYFSEKYGLLEKTPVTLHVKDTRIVGIECVNKELLRELEEYIKTDENANRISEFAVGTNVGLTRLVGNLLQDEKFPGVHVAFGSGYPHETGSDVHSKVHCDAVLKDCTIIVDDDMIMKDGKFLL